MFLEHACRLGLVACHDAAVCAGIPVWGRRTVAVGSAMAPPRVVGLADFPGGDRPLPAVSVPGGGGRSLRRPWRTPAAPRQVYAERRSVRAYDAVAPGFPDYEVVLQAPLGGSPAPLIICVGRPSGSTLPGALGLPQEPLAVLHDPGDPVWKGHWQTQVRGEGAGGVPAREGRRGGLFLALAGATGAAPPERAVPHGCARPAEHQVRLPRSGRAVRVPALPARAAAHAVREDGGGRTGRASASHLLPLSPPAPPSVCPTEPPSAAATAPLPSLPSAP